MKRFHSVADVEAHLRRVWADPGPMYPRAHVEIVTSEVDGGWLVEAIHPVVGVVDTRMVTEEDRNADPQT